MRYQVIFWYSYTSCNFKNRINTCISSQVLSILWIESNLAFWSILIAHYCVWPRAIHCYMGWTHVNHIMTPCPYSALGSLWIFYILWIWTMSCMHLRASYQLNFPKNPLFIFFFSSLTIGNRSYSYFSCSRMSYS